MFITANQLHDSHEDWFKITNTCALHILPNESKLMAGGQEPEKLHLKQA